MTALWAMLTRMKKPLRREVRQGAVRPGRASWGRSRRRCSTPTTITPEGLSTEQQRELVAGRREDRARVGQLPELRGPHRRLAARDEAGDHERGAEPALRVPVAVRDLRRAGGPGPRRDRLRVPEAGAAAGRLPREPQVHLPGARPADRQDRRRGADVDGPGRRAALHGALRALRRARLVLGQAREGAEPDHRPRRGSRRGHDGGGRAHPAGERTARRVPARGDQPHRRLVDRSPPPEARLRRDLPAPDRRAARVVLRGAQEAGPQDQRGPAGLPGRRSREDAARRGRGRRRDAGRR